MKDYLMNILLPLSITFFFSFFIGLERQNIGKSAGISAHVITSMAACAISIMQMYIIKDYPSFDGSRVIAQVVVGVGFIGAGIILKSTKNVKGLTTATTLWGSAMTGLILGMRYFYLGITIGLFIVLFMYLRDVSRHINPFKKNRDKYDHHDDDPEER